VQARGQTVVSVVRRSKEASLRRLSGSARRSGPPSPDSCCDNITSLQPLRTTEHGTVKIAHVWPRVFLAHTQSSTPAAGRASSGRQFAVLQPPRARLRRGELQRHRPSLFQRPLDVPPPIRPHAYPACWATLPHDSVVAVSVSIACDCVADVCCCACTRPGLRCTTAFALLEACLIDRRRPMGVWASKSR
jgi:hypothetical protein